MTWEKTFICFLQEECVTSSCQGAAIECFHQTEVTVCVSVRELQLLHVCVEQNQGAERASRGIAVCEGKSTCLTSFHQPL